MRTSAGAQVRPGDRIALKIWNEPEMSDTFHVAENGEVTLPRLGSRLVTGRSAGELQESLREAYREYLREPSVQLLVLRRIGVQGEVQEPNLYYADLTMTLRDVIALAGGITPEGNPRDIRIIRDGEEMRIDQTTLARFSALDLRSGDQVVVGRRSWFELNSLSVISAAAVVVSVLYPIAQALF